MKCTLRANNSGLSKMTSLIVFLLLLLLGNEMAYSSSSTNIKKLSRQVRQLSGRCVCGKENTNTKLQRIIAGTEIKPELRFPWLVPLAYRNGTFFCAGTLINNRYILTSAHCFRYSRQDAAGELRYMISGDAVIVPERITSNMLVGLGVHNLISDDHQPPLNTNADQDKIQPIWQTIDYAVVHRFYENYESAIIHDIALIRLRKEIDFDRFKWLRPICLPDEDQFELGPFNKFQLEEYVQPNINSRPNDKPASSDHMKNNHRGHVGSHNNSQIGGQTNGQLNSQMNSQVNNQVNNQVKFQPNSQLNGQTNNQTKNQINRLTNNQVKNQSNNQMTASVMNNHFNRPTNGQINNNRINNQLANLINEIYNPQYNGTISYSSGLTPDENIDLLSYSSIMIGNETLKTINRINSKRLSLEKFESSREGREMLLREEEDDGLYFSVGWGSTDHSFNGRGKLSKVPLWMQVRMLSREQCILKNGEGVKWNFICGEGMEKNQETSVGDSGGPLFGQIRRKSSNKFNRPMNLNARYSTPNTVRTTTHRPTTSTRSSSRTAGPAMLIQRTMTTTTTTPRTTTTQKTTNVPTTNTTTTTPTTERAVIKYISKPPLPFKFLSKRPQRQPQQQQQQQQHYQASNEMNSLLVKVKENTNRHFYSAMIYEDLFKTLNLPHDDLSKLSKEDEKEVKDVIDGEDMDADENVEPLKTTMKPSTGKLDNNTSTDEFHELDLSTSNYVQLGITSWSSYLNPEIGMYTDIRAYMGWIMRNTRDAQYCISNPSKLIDEKIPLPTEKPGLPDSNSNLDCGAEKLNKTPYPWLTSLYIDDKFLGNCVYFYSNFVICSDIYVEQTSSDVNTVVHRFSVQFYYPNYRFRARNVVNRLSAPLTPVNRREYLIIQLEDPDGKLPRDVTNRRFNRAIIDAQINKHNPQAGCLIARDYYPFNEETSSLITFYLFAPGENLIKTNLKLTAYRKCRQLAPNFVSKRFLCAEIGSNEEINVSDQFTFNRKPFHSTIPARVAEPSALSLPNATSIPFTMKLRNFFRIQSISNHFHGHYSDLANFLKNDFDEHISLNDSSLNKQNETENEDDKRSRAMVDSSNFKELLDGQPVFHKIEEQYTLVGFLVKAPFPHTLAFRRNNLVLLLDLRKFRFQLVTKLIKSLRSYSGQ